MTHTKTVEEKEASTTVSTQTKVEVPARLVTTIAARVEASGVDNPAAEDVRDFAHDHVETSTEFVTPDGQSLETAVLAHVRSPAVDPLGTALEDEELVDIPLEEDTLAAVDEAAERSGVDRLEWIRRAVAGRMDTDGVGLTFDEDDISSSESTPDPIDVDATAQLDFAAEPERPLSIDVAIPADMIGEGGLEALLDTVSIDARIVDE